MNTGDVYFWDETSKFYLVMYEYNKGSNCIKTVMVFNDKDLSDFWKYGFINEKFILDNMSKFKSLSPIEIETIKKEFVDYLEYAR